MSTVTDLICNFGDVFELDYPTWDTARIIEQLKQNPNWCRYNPRKPHINRWGLSVTSLDGSVGCGPDLDSLREYNLENPTAPLHEFSFTTLTEVGREIPESANVINTFPTGTVGRSHFLRLDAGGFFPPHRDNGIAVPGSSMRIVVPLVDFDAKGASVWLLDGAPLHLKAGRTYFVNTSKVHSVFSFADGCYLMVYNVRTTAQAITYCASRALIK